MLTHVKARTFNFIFRIGEIEIYITFMFRSHVVILEVVQ